ncbi:glycosyltransferase family A protein [Aureimonas sp. SK2]|uniref:glycosyltransferase n=1 Tax=Aureimonas sp. SK2 TaxID=3015992 RepID=UPI002444B671|nr:glycosyltransferase family A protein [Aureimonas sp. SK2]
MQPDHPVVAVPVRNEERRIANLLRALAAQSWCRTTGRRLPVVLVLNNCTDRTHDVVAQALSDLAFLRVDLLDIHLPAAQAHVGTARRMAMDRAAALCPPGRGVVLTTDADAVPDPDWIEATLRAVARGADLVGGKLYGNRAEEERLGAAFSARAASAATYAGHCDRLAALIDPLDHDPWPRHADHTGGSLAIRADLYRALGGLPPLPRREDLALVSAARAAGALVAHPPDVRVEVSARLIGRAQGGMADCLKAWMRAETEGLPLLVEAPSRVEARLKRRRAVRDLHRLPPPARGRAMRALGIDPSLFPAGSELPSPGWLVERFAPDEPDAEADTPVGEAIAGMLERIARQEGAMRAA